jgi:ATP-dependent RNA helicase RhlB
MERLLRIPSQPQEKPTQPRGFILAPTRELAIQIHKDALQLGRFTDLKFGLVYGGVDYDKQRLKLQSGVDVLIGTPGRIIDYYKQKVLVLRSIQVVVLDEADRMFDLGFIRDVRFLLRRMPRAEKRLNLLFSATLSLRVKELAYEHMNNPQVVEIEPDKMTVDGVNQLLYHVGSKEKLRLLVALIEQAGPKCALVFVNTKRAAERVAASLRRYGFYVAVLSGDVPQRKRQQLIRYFARGDLPIVVATDVAARGLHIPRVTHVFNYDLPQNEEDYVHRIGRTARAGASGDAISLACEEHVYSLIDIEAYLGYKIPVAVVTDDLLSVSRPTSTPQRSSSRKGRGRQGGRRG